MNKANRYQLSGLILLVCFALFSFFVQKDLFTGFDLSTTVKIQEKLPDFLITLFSIFSLLGSVEIASLILLAGMFLFKFSKKIYVLLFYSLAGAIELAGKTLIEHSGPPIMFLKTNIHFGFPSGGISGDFFSYPSGHAARTAFISGVLLFALWKSSFRRELKYTLAGLILTFDFVMFISRVYLGEHWLTDVVGGALLGVSLGIIASAFISAKTKRAN